ncbi:hypothetical protein [Aquimarina intermedia]|uniref:Protein required for attachment to host cells n=1 Tax=Aquimarina intermedia TaxID=350814 RepID=A0A5S5C4J1_9FLAO|nr:hypothetical protein [Aquimarina intermedia]TYP74254.1 hypothetical protein BD809_10472 [Aquimarina intermedia]
MKNVGIWIDKEKTKIVDLEKDTIETVFSEIEDFHIQGGSGTRFKGGPQDVVQDSKYLEREKHQTKAYFKKIIPFLDEANSIVIFGPAETGEKLRKELSENHPMIIKKLREVQKADSMTDNQMKAWVREYYRN